MREECTKNLGTLSQWHSGINTSIHVSIVSFMALMITFIKTHPFRQSRFVVGHRSNGRPLLDGSMADAPPQGNYQFNFCVDISERIGSNSHPRRILLHIY